MGHCQLTDSLARTDVVLFIHRTVRLIILRVADLPAVLLVDHFEKPQIGLARERRVLARRGRTGETGNLFEHP